MRLQAGDVVWFFLVRWQGFLSCCGQWTWGRLQGKVENSTSSLVNVYLEDNMWGESVDANKERIQGVFIQ